MNYIHKFPLFHQKFQNISFDGAFRFNADVFVLNRADNPKIINMFTRNFFTKSENFPKSKFSPQKFKNDLSKFKIRIKL